MSSEGQTEHERDPAPQPGSDEPHGPGSSIGERITGIRDPKDPDGLLTLDDLPDPTGDASNLGTLLRKASRYGDDTAR
jgi:hypothetical protein